LCAGRESSCDCGHGRSASGTIGSMSNRRISLAVWAGRPPTAEPPKLEPSDLLYSAPNRDGTRKSCLNCLFWLGSASGPLISGEHARPSVGGREECFLHDADVLVSARMVCGYHVEGAGLSGLRVPRENMTPLDPEFSGLCSTTDGSSCELCVHFRPVGALEGTCAVAWDVENNQNAVVHRNGCCSAWHERVE
jgi:hypothetical protein